MKIKSLEIIIIIFFLSVTRITYSQIVYDPDISKKDAQALFAKLYADMQGLHPNLYEHISKEDYDKVYDEIMYDLDTTDTYKAVTLLRAFEIFVALCRDSHSGVGLSREIINAGKKNIKSVKTDPVVQVFPFAFKIIQGKMYNAYDCFSNGAIPIGSEIVAIGSQTTKEWLRGKKERMSNERDAHKDAIISIAPAYKYLHVDSCRFGYIPCGMQDTLYETLNCSIHVQEYDECLLSITGEEDIIGFRPLDGGRIGVVSMYFFYPVKEMLPYVERVLDSLQFYQAEDLIIDLRMSPGGHAEIVDEFIKRITDSSFFHDSEEQIFIKSAMQNCSNKHMRKIWQHRKYIKKSDVKQVWASGKDTIITHKFTEIQPKAYKNKYSGHIWILTGTYTFSAAVGFAEIIQDCKLGTVAGEETGGAQNTYGNPMFYPLSGILNDKQIQFYYIAPYIKSIRLSGDDSMKLRGVIPDIEIEPNLTYEEDTQLQTLIEIIQKQRDN